MRTTIAIEDDVLTAARAIARHRNQSVGKIVSELARHSLRPPVARDRPGRRQNIVVDGNRRAHHEAPMSHHASCIMHQYFGDVTLWRGMLPRNGPPERINEAIWLDQSSGGLCSVPNGSAAGGS